MLPMKRFPEVEDFLAQHGGKARFRRPILAIVGGTRLGKSLLAAALLRFWVCLGDKIQHLAALALRGP